MINKAIVFKVLGTLLLFESMMMLACLVVAFLTHGDDIFAFLLSSLITVMGGVILRWLGRGASNTLGRRDAYLVVTLVWVAFSLFGMLPFIISGYIINVTDAFFETASGFTTTGASIISNVETMPRGLLCWRSLTQWIGGLGIVFFTIAILPSMVEGNVKIFAAEATGPMKTKLHPRLGTTAKWIWGGYTALTLSCALVFFLSGMTPFESVNYAMTTTATGGFAIHNDALMHFRNSVIEYESIFFQLAGGVNFTLLYLALFRLKIKQFLRDSELRFFALLITVSTTLIMLMLIFDGGYPLERAFRSALFHVVSFVTTTGLFNDSIAAWPHTAWIILGALMFTGACGGSTSGGFKCIRVVMLFKVLRNELRRLIHPNAVLPVRINGRSLPSTTINTLLAFLVVYLVTLAAAAIVMMLTGVDHINAINIALSCVSNVGPTLGQGVGPDLSWIALTTPAKWVCTLLMIAGRLELFGIIVLFTRSFWKDN